MTRRSAHPSAARPGPFIGATLAAPALAILLGWPLLLITGLTAASRLLIGSP